MRYPFPRTALKRSSGVTAILLLALVSPLFPPNEPFSIPSAQAQIPSDRATETEQLYQQGIEQVNRGQYEEALETFTQMMNLLRQRDDPTGEALTLNNIGGIYLKLGWYPHALKFYQGALALVQAEDNPNGEGRILNNIGLVHFYQGEHAQALEFYQQALAIYEELPDQKGAARTLTNLARVRTQLGEYTQAQELLERALLIHEQLDDKPGKAAALNSQGEVYRYLGQYEEALAHFEQALVLYQQLEDSLNVGNTFGNIGLAHYYLGQYPQALGFYQEALKIAQDLGNYGGLGVILNSIGKLHQQLGQPEQALEYYQEALNVATTIVDPVGREVALSNIGQVFRQNDKPDKALQFYEQALELARATQNRAGEGIALSNLGLVWATQGENQRALALYEEALAIHQEIGDRASEGVTLSNMASVYLQRGDYSEALTRLQQALAIHLEVRDRTNERIALSKLGKLFEQQGQPELAIVFYKQAVNVAETQRQGLAGLSAEQQRSYTQTVADTYRHLADLLLQQDRILEAQQVLDLLKVQELDDYLHNVRGEEDKPDGVAERHPEQQILQGTEAIIERAIVLGQELTQLTNIPLSERTETQRERIVELRKQEQEITQQFNRFLNSEAVQNWMAQLKRNTDGESFDLQNARALKDNLEKLEDTVILYPLVLDDRLELVLVTPYAPPTRHTVNVAREDLNRAIAEFRSALENPHSNAEVPAQKLYDWLIQPLETNLTQANAKTLIYAPDGQLRYIPLAALHDGESWLSERFRVNNITAVSLTDLDTQPQSELRILAGAFTQGTYTVEAGGERFTFAGLPFAEVEVENLAQLIPSTEKRLDDQFDADTIYQMNDYSVVHLATHAAFVMGQPEESFIVFGDGSAATLRDVESWTLDNVDLVVLSACETGVGDELGDGKEILGFGYQMQRTGARAAIASLWRVSDGGTQALMNAFYAALQNENVTKAEALRRAQIALITDDYSVLGEERGIIEVRQRVREGLEPEVRSRLGHPYYWAPFILIGNGL